MPRPICVKCKTFLRCTKNEICWEQRTPHADGTSTPYKLWNADLWECPTCKVEVILGTAGRPFSEHYKPDYARLRETSPPVVQVLD